MTELVVGQRYDFHTTDGTVYENAVLKAVYDDGECLIRYGTFTVVYIAAHEITDAVLCLNDPAEEETT